jgi:TolB protein
MSRRIVAAVTGPIALLCLLAPLAHAGFPGANGKIAFDSDRESQSEVFVMNADGGAVTRLSTAGEFADGDPAWSADGARLVFSCGDGVDLCVADADGSDGRLIYGSHIPLPDPAFSLDGTAVVFTEGVEFCDPPGDPTECWIASVISAVDSDGTDHRSLTPNNGGGACCPRWSPRNDRIVFVDWGLGTMNTDGTARTPLPACCSHPDWSPDGTRIVFTRDLGTTTSNHEIFVSNADGSGETRLTANSVDDEQPAWSPDGQRIVFQSDEGGDYEIFVMNADGGGRAQLTNNSVRDGAPDWQPLAYPGYARPKSTGPTYAFLVPAYGACAEPDREHGPPLAYPSCSSPDPVSSQLTVGTPDANGAPPRSSGYVRYGAAAGNPATPADEADVRFFATLSDVRRASGLADYEGEVELRMEVRITDRGNGPAADERGTVEDFDFRVTVPCAATADTTIGAQCGVTTTAEAVVPGALTEGDRAVWALGAARVYDGGPDGSVATQDNTLFAVQGLFVP